MACLSDDLIFILQSQQEHDALIQEITKLLLDHGCDPMVKNKEGESPFNLAVKEVFSVLFLSYVT